MQKFEIQISGTEVGTKTGKRKLTIFYNRHFRENSFLDGSLVFLFNLSPIATHANGKKVATCSR
jgi:hypothetical protein